VEGDFKTMMRLGKLNGWERLWLVTSVALVCVAVVYSLQIKDYKGLRLDASCIGYTVDRPAEDYEVAKEKLKQIFQGRDYTKRYYTDENGVVVRETSDEGELFALREVTGYFDYQCTTYNAVSKSIFFALLTSLFLYAGGHLAVWVKRGFGNDVSH
jgi:hypothetical protein